MERKGKEWIENGEWNEEERGENGGQEGGEEGTLGGRLESSIEKHFIDLSQIEKGDCKGGNDDRKMKKKRIKSQKKRRWNE